MKKTRIIVIFLLGVLGLIPIINSSVAAPPAYVGVSVGETYKWKVGIHYAGLSALFTDMGAGTLPPELSMYETMPINLIAEVAAVSDENNISSYYYANVSLTISMEIPGTTTVPMMPPGMYLVNIVLDNNTVDYIYGTMAIVSYFMGLNPYDPIFAFLIVAKNVNWTYIANDINFVLNMDPYMPNGTATAHASGITVNIDSQLFDPDGGGPAPAVLLDPIEVYANYRANGVLERAHLKYGGALAGSLGPTAGGEIPGYEIPLVLGITGAVTIGMIIYIRKKRKIIH